MNKNINGDKSKLRDYFLNKRLELSAIYRDKANKAIFENIKCFVTENKFSEVLLYADIRNEPSLLGLVEEESVLQTATFFLPRSEGPGLMNFYRWDGKAPLVENSWGIREPRQNPQMLYYPNETSQTLVITPSILVDQFGVRLGYGGGFYDRFLERYPKAVTLAPLWAELFDPEVSLPEDPWDKKIQWLCHEHKLFHCIENKKRVKA